MTITGWIIEGLAIALFGVLAVGGTFLNYERKQHRRETERIKKEGAENAQHTADIITDAEKIKQDANTGNQSNDLHTMADQLHHYANSGKYPRPDILPARPIRRNGRARMGRNQRRGNIHGQRGRNLFAVVVLAADI